MSSSSEIRKPPLPLINKSTIYTYFVLLQEYAGEDNQDLFLEERESAIKTAQDEKRKVQMSVPGILGPHEIPEEMQDWSAGLYSAWTTMVVNQTSIIATALWVPTMLSWYKWPYMLYQQMFTAISGRPWHGVVSILSAMPVVWRQN